MSRRRASLSLSVHARKVARSSLMRSRSRRTRSAALRSSDSRLRANQRCSILRTRPVTGRIDDECQRRHCEVHLKAVGVRLTFKMNVAKALHEGELLAVLDALGRPLGEGTNFDCPFVFADSGLAGRFQRPEACSPMRDERE